MTDDIYPNFGIDDDTLSSVNIDLNIALNEQNPLDSREDAIKKISDENSIDEDFLKEQILNSEYNDLNYLDISEI